MHPELAATLDQIKAELSGARVAFNRTFPPLTFSKQTFFKLSKLDLCGRRSDLLHLIKSSLRAGVIAKKLLNFDDNIRFFGVTVCRSKLICVVKRH